MRARSFTWFVAVVALNALVGGGVALAKGKKKKPAAAAAKSAPAAPAEPGEKMHGAPKPVDPPAPATSTTGETTTAAPDAPKKKHHKAWPIPAMGGSVSGSPEVLFTFDDGPSSEYTSSVLDTLKDHGVHAIFFLVGNRVTGFPNKARLAALIARVYDEGHAIGNHTVNHKDLCKKSSADKIEYEIDTSAKLLEDQTGMNMVLFRTPFGVRCPQLEVVLDARHLKHVHWDIDAQEWKTKDAVKTQEYIIRELGRLGDSQRAVVLIHDIHEATAKALPVILTWIDTENARRIKKGLRPIKLLGPADVAMERLEPGVAPLLDQTTGFVDRLVPGLERRVLGPLAGLDGPAHAASL